MASRLRWGDVEESSEHVGGPPAAASATATATTSAAPLGVLTDSTDRTTGIRTTVEYITNDLGQRLKVTRKVKKVTKTVSINRHIVERRGWKKFGDCANAGPGPEYNVTIQSPEVISLELRAKNRDEEDETKEESALDKLQQGSSIVVCSYCKEPGHFSLKCPKRSQLAPVRAANDDLGLGPDLPPGAAGLGGGAGAADRYVPMHLRAGGGGSARFDARNEEPTLRVTNLSEDTTEADLQELFRRFGHTTRIYLARDRVTNQSRGFAFVNFSNRSDAATAIEKLNGHGYDNLILHVEWAKPKTEDTRRS